MNIPVNTPFNMQDMLTYKHFLFSIERTEHSYLTQKQCHHINKTTTPHRHPVPFSLHILLLFLFSFYYIILISWHLIIFLYFFRFF